MTDRMDQTDETERIDFLCGSKIIDYLDVPTCVVKNFKVFNDHISKGDHIVHTQISLSGETIDLPQCGKKYISTVVNMFDGKEWTLDPTEYLYLYRCIKYLGIDTNPDDSRRGALGYVPNDPVEMAFRNRVAELKRGKSGKEVFVMFRGLEEYEKLSPEKREIVDSVKRFR